MMGIETLVSDIESLLKNGTTEVPEEAVQAFADSLAVTIASRLKPSPTGPRGLRMSNVGQPCLRKLYYDVNHEDGKEELSASTRMKFLYGDLIEELILFLAEVAGHKVEGRQDTLELEGIPGHRDAVIDGEIVDVKSASPFSFKKFKEGRLSEDDAFGYSDQLQSYLEAGQDDPLVTEKGRGHFLVLDKVGGHICLDTHKKQDFPIRNVLRYRKKVVESDELPARTFDPVPEGKSGNEKLPLVCSYCDWKKKCHPGLRTFLYAGGKPVFLTKVVKEPKVPELTNEVLDEGSEPEMEV